MCIIISGISSVNNTSAVCEFKYAKAQMRSEDYQWITVWIVAWTFLNEWMNEWGIYIALYCVLLYTQSALQSYEGVSLQPPPVCSIHLDDATAATGQRRQCAHHTPDTGGEEREIEPIKWMGITRRPWLIRASGGNLARTPGLHPYSFTMSVMGFLMTTESQDLGLTSHPKEDFWVNCSFK